MILSLECSSALGSLSLVEERPEALKLLGFKEWRMNFNHISRIKNAHSAMLATEIEQIFKKAQKPLSSLKALGVGVGPGRWTGIRSAVTVIKSLGFCLNIPIYPINSLRICAEEALLSSKGPVFVALNGFKNQVYFAEFHSLEEEEVGNQTALLPFSVYSKQMELKAGGGGGKPICVSDLMDFYPLSSKLKESFLWKKPRPSALSLTKILFRQKKSRKPKSWKELAPFYLRSPMDGAN